MPSKTPAKRTTTTRSKKKQSLLSRINFTSKKVQLLFVVAIFAIVGSAFLYRSFAAVNQNNDSKLIIKVVGLPAGNTVLVDSIANAFVPGEPAHDVGNCRKLITLTGNAAKNSTKECVGFRMGPIAMAPRGLLTYRSSWSGCDGYDSTRLACWMSLYDGNGRLKSKTVTLTFTPTNYVPPSSVNQGACVGKTFRQGANDACVTHLKRMLNYDVYSLNSNSYLTINNVYDTMTTNAVKTWQGRTGLSQTGTTDPATWTQVCNPRKGPPPAWFNNAAKAAGCSGY